MRVVEELIQILTSRGVRLREEKGQLRFSAPKGALTPELREEMAERRDELLAFVRNAREATRPGAEPIPPRSPGTSIPLSFAQQRLWFLDQLHPGNPAYNLPHALRIRGPLDQGALQEAFKAVVERHEALRTVFVAREGVPSQIVQDPGPVELTLEDLAGAGDQDGWVRRLLAREARRPFDLERGPLIRGHLWRLGPQDHLLSVVMHHMVSDGWSEAVFAGELVELYSARSSSRPPDLPHLPVQFGDYALWQRQKAAGESGPGREYWRSTLAGAPAALDLVTDEPRPSTQSFAGDRFALTIPPSVGGELASLATDEVTTPFTVILAAWAAVLARHARQTDLVVGVPVANRDRLELEPLIGFLVNTLALRLDLSGQPTARELVARVRRSLMDALEHQDVPFEEVVDDLGVSRDLSRPPVFQTMVAMAPSEAVALPQGLEWEPVEVDFPFARLDLTLFIRGGPEEGFTGELEYNADLFLRSTAEALASHVQRILAAMAGEPDGVVDSIPLLDREDRHALLVEWNRTEAEFPGNRCAPDLVEEQAGLTPDAVAVRSPSGTLSYDELNRRAERTARGLMAMGVGPGDVVGLLMQRNPDLLVALLGVWKAGAAFLPLDPSYPVERLAFMVQDAGASLVVVDQEGEGALGPSVRLADLEEAGGEAEEEAEEEAEGETGGEAVPRGPSSPEALAYVIYTSGSSGRPKGVRIPHRGLVNYLEWSRRAYPMGEGTGAPVYTSLGFDATLTSLLVPLIAGRTAHLLPEEGGLEALADLLRSPVGYSFVKLTPAHLDLLGGMVGEELHPESTRSIIVGGEALLGRHLTQWRRRLPGIPVFNEYGPTETVVGCCVHELRPEDPIPPGRVPIGRPIANTRLFVLDEGARPVPPGVPGELWVGGAGVGLGYLNRPDLSAESFPTGGLPEAGEGRLYRTGDLVRHLEDGTLDFLGRVDAQINLNGFRVEPGEVEAALGAHPGVGECVVVAREGGAGGRPRLVAYYVPAPARSVGEPGSPAGEQGSSPEEQELRGWLSRELPEFMVPAALLALEALPLTPNGKVDRDALPAPSRVRPRADHVAPSTEAERTLAGIWKEVLGVDRVGIHDNFFDLGGDSILSIQVVARAAREGLVLTPRLLFQHQTVAELAALAETAEEAALAAPSADPAPSADAGQERGPTSGRVPLTPIQHWFFGRELVAPHHYNQALLLETSPGTEASWLERAFAAVAAHHRVFRHRFMPGEDGWLQEVGDDHGDPSFEVLDLSGTPAADRQETITRVVDRLQETLNLEHGPVVRALFIRCGDDPGRLAMVAHHLVVDGVSWRILLDDLVHCYRQISQGRDPGLPPSTPDFGSWARGLEALAGTEEVSRDLEGWERIMGAPGARLPTELSGEAEENTAASAGEVSVELTAPETTLLLESAPRRHNATVNELLLTALGSALGSWCSGSHLLVEMEGHGRDPRADLGTDPAGAGQPVGSPNEDLVESLGDVSRTVGWFTTLFPFPLPLHFGERMAAGVGAVAASLKALPSQGFTYGVLRYLHTRGGRLEPGEGEAPQVSWNYLGRWQGPEGELPFQGVAKEPVGRMTDPGQRRSHLLEVEAVVLEGRLQVEWRFSRAFHRADTIEALADRFGEAVRELLQAVSPAREETPAPLAGLDEDQLERLSGVLEDLDGDAAGGDG